MSSGALVRILGELQCFSTMLVKTQCACHRRTDLLDHTPPTPYHEKAESRGEGSLRECHKLPNQQAEDCFLVPTVTSDN